MLTRFHLTENAFVLKFLFQRTERLINIILTDVDFDHVSVQLTFGVIRVYQFCLNSIAKGPGLPAEPAFRGAHNSDSSVSQGIFAVGRWHKDAIVGP